MTLTQFFETHRVANAIVVPAKVRAIVTKLKFTMGPAARSEQLLPAFLAAARRRKKKQRSR
jgi:hypothetical protein